MKSTRPRRVLHRDPKREHALLVAPRVGHAPYVTPGSELGACGQCGQECWLDADALKILRPTGLPIRVLCHHCAGLQAG